MFNIFMNKIKGYFEAHILLYNLIRLRRRKEVFEVIRKRLLVSKKIIKFW